jgi:hypothetical protein
MYVDTQEYMETDLGYLPGDMYNRLMIALDFYQEKRNRDAFGYFQEEYENRGTKLTVEGLVGAKEKAKVEVQNARMCHFRPTRDNSKLTWSLEANHPPIQGCRPRETTITSSARDRGNVRVPVTSYHILNEIFVLLSPIVTLR